MATITGAVAHQNENPLPAKRPVVVSERQLRAKVKLAIEVLLCCLPQTHPYHVF